MEIMASLSKLHSAFNGLISEYEYLRPALCGDFYIQLAFHIVQFPICTDALE